MVAPSLLGRVLVGMESPPAKPLGGAKEPEEPSRRWYRVHQVDDLTFYVRRDPGPLKRDCKILGDDECTGYAGVDWQRCLSEDFGCSPSPDSSPNLDFCRQISTPVANMPNSTVVTKATLQLSEGVAGKAIHRSPRKMKKMSTVTANLERNLGIEQQGFDVDVFNNCCRVCYEQRAEVVLLPCRHCGLCKDCYRSTLFSRPAHRGGRACPFCRSRIREAIQLHREAGAAVQYGYAIDVH